MVQMADCGLSNAFLSNKRQLNMILDTYFFSQAKGLESSFLS